jgi:hypothetical protein
MSFNVEIGHTSERGPRTGNEDLAPPPPATWDPTVALERVIAAHNA